LKTAAADERVADEESEKESIQLIEEVSAEVWLSHWMVLLPCCCASF
jgi:hypothetical protein